MAEVNSTLTPFPLDQPELKHPRLHMQRLADELKKSLTPLQRQILCDVLLSTDKWLNVVGMNRSQTAGFLVVLHGDPDVPRLVEFFRDDEDRVTPAPDSNEHVESGWVL